MIGRRVFLAASALLLARAARAASPPSPELEQHDLRLDGDPRLARRALLLVPKHLPAGAPLRVLVLLHGLGETGNELLGIHAWGERYGLVRAYERLRAPPIERTLARQRYLTDEHLAELNAALAERPFHGLALLCPVTPRAGGARDLDRYADWIERNLLPAARARAPIGAGPAHVGLDGCSLGGRVALEVFLRKPSLFGTLGTVQAAVSVSGAAGYAERLARALREVGPRPLHLETSTGDPYRAAVVALGRELARRDVPATVTVLPGPHDQPFLREIGTLELLHFHDRALASLGSTAETPGP